VKTGKMGPTERIIKTPTVSGRRRLGGNPPRQDGESKGRLVMGKIDRKIDLPIVWHEAKPSLSSTSWKKGRPVGVRAGTKKVRGKRGSDLTLFS